MCGTDHQFPSLFDGTHIPESYRGRSSRGFVFNRSSHWVIATFCALLFGLTTAATAITIRHNAHNTQVSSSEHSQPANFNLRWGGGFEETLY